MHRHWGFRYEFVSPFGFWFRTGWRFPRRGEYVRMLEWYREELEAEPSAEDEKGLARAHYCRRQLS
jgi:hypothetical protein